MSFINSNHSNKVSSPEKDINNNQTGQPSLQRRSGSAGEEVVIISLKDAYGLMEATSSGSLPEKMSPFADAKNLQPSELRAFLLKHGISPRKEYHAIKEMCNMANGEDISPEDGQKYFHLQHGATVEEQCLNLMIEFDQLPSEILANKKIEKRFVNETFIKQWDYIEGYPDTKPDCSYSTYKVNMETSGIDPREESNILLRGVRELHRLPSNISKHSAVVDYIKLCSSKVMTLPASFSKLHKLATLKLSGSPMENVPQIIEDMPTLISLTFSCNEIASFPPSIKKTLKHIVCLNLRGNPIMDFAHNKSWYPRERKKVEVLIDAILKSQKLKNK